MPHALKDLVESYFALKPKSNFAVRMVDCWNVNRHQSQGSQYKGGSPSAVKSNVATYSSLKNLYTYSNTLTLGDWGNSRGKTGLLGTINFRIINNSLSVMLLTKMHGIACFATYNFKVFRGSIRPGPLKLACHFSANRVSAACYAYVTHMQTSPKYPDQISDRHRSRGCTIVALLFCNSAPQLKKKIFFDMTVTSTKYKHQKVNVWPKTLRGDHEIYQ